MACRAQSGESVFSERGRREMREFDNPKNSIELALNKSKQTIEGYRVKVLRNGFLSKARKKNGKIILRLTPVSADCFK
jgi:hypothetical protein